MFVPRDYQEDATDAILCEFMKPEIRSTACIMAVGTGKTSVFSLVAHHWHDRRVLILEHREELIDQAIDRLKLICDEEIGLEMGNHKVNKNSLWPTPRIIVASKDTLYKPHRLKNYARDEFGLIITDETHHAGRNNSTYQDIYGYFTDYWHAGFTATGDRADGEALPFQTVAFRYPMLKAIEQGYLVPVVSKITYVESLDVSWIKQVAGDLYQGELDEILTEEPHLHMVVDPILKTVGDRQTLVFANSVQHAKLLAIILNRSRPGSAHAIHGGTDRDLRRRLVESYRNDEFQFLVNMGVFCEGVDLPNVEVVAMARPTTSRYLYEQILGRGMRPRRGVIDGLRTAEERRAAIAADRKKVCLILDFVGNSGSHKLLSAVDVIGINYRQEVRERVVQEVIKLGLCNLAIELAKQGKLDEEGRKRAEKEKAEKDEELRKARIAAEERKALGEAREARMQERRRDIRIDTKFRMEEVDPFDVLDTKAKREPGWFKGKRPTVNMIQCLQRNGVETKTMTYWQAKTLIDDIIARSKAGLCTFRQAKLLKSFGHETEHLSFADAGVLITALKANGWQKEESSGTVAENNQGGV